MDELSWAPLTPTAFLRRSGQVFADRLAVVDGERRFTYGELSQRATALAGGLAARGAGPGAFVAVLAPNTHHLLEAHFGVPLAGATIVPLNIRLAPAELGYILGHCGARILLADHELAGTAREAAAVSGHDVDVVVMGGPDDAYEPLLASAEPLAHELEDERALLAVNYTSGTTGRPKGVMYHHRGAYLQGLAMALHARLASDGVYLWTLPMFHCNGWCFPYAVTAAGATHVCLRKVDPGEAWRLARAHGVTHFCAAPTVLTALAHDPAADPDATGGRIHALTGGAPPSPTLLERCAELGIDVTHLYGLTETFGPAVVCDFHPEWRGEDLATQARLKARQGVGNVIAEPVRVVDEHGADVPADGATLGEVALRGNNVMLGYLHDPEATAHVAPDGWFRTGDLGVRHPDGYVELRDRAKDVIVSGGENIASIEVEQALASHPAVLEAAVIAVPDERWGEVPAAYVTLKPGATADADELIAHVKARIARYKAPKRVEFGDLPKTSTGKIQKYVLREAAWAGRDRRIS